MNWLSRLLCLIGCHDWREMNGRCRECGYEDPLWKNWKYDEESFPTPQEPRGEE